MAHGRPRLWHLPSSHFSEKVRWALDHKRVPHVRRVPLAVPHYVVARALTRGAVDTFPVLQSRRGNVGDSSAISAALDHAAPDPPLYPSGDDDRRRAREIEDWFDEHL